MTVTKFRIRTVLGGTAPSFDLPRTEAEAKRRAREMNDPSAQDRARKERARLLEITEQMHRAIGRGRVRARIDATAIYRSRREATDPQAAVTAAPTPHRPRTIRDLASAYYGAAEGDGQLIPAGPRGGAS